MVASPSPNDPSAHLANLQIDRLVGFDTPERGDSARCEDERWRAEAATTRLRQLIAAGNARLQRVACACRPGEEGTSRCNYGRLCGSLTVGGRDVGQILIGEGLARSYVCSGTRCPRGSGGAVRPRCVV
jgi:endonuclease YncB( thermonuclease family)